MLSLPTRAILPELLNSEAFLAVYQLLTWILFTGMLAYLLSLLMYRRGLRSDAPRLTGYQPRISVVIAVKNELRRLPRLLSDLSSQTYPPELLEVIIVDNESDDGSLAFLEDACLHHTKLKVFSTSAFQTTLRRKKAALALGIAQASGEIIITTDADCTLPPEWLATMASYFHEDVGAVVGFSGIKYGADWFSRLQAFDYLQLMTAARGATNLDFAWACSGQNWAFRKKYYDHVGGYRELASRVGGDDSLFLQIMRRKTGLRVVFAADSRAWVATDAVTDWKTFLRQRIRWASEANYMRLLNPVFFGVVVGTFLANLGPLFFGLSALGGHGGWGVFLLLTGIKLGGELSLAHAAVKIHHRRELLRVFPLWFVFQIPYTVSVGILSFWGNKVEWHGKARRNPNVAV